MLKFLFGRISGDRNDGKPVAETQRDAMTRVLGELNALIAGCTEKPRITIDPNTGTFELELPDQFPDEMQALPAPDTVAPAAEDKAA